MIISQKKTQTLDKIYNAINNNEIILKGYINENYNYTLNNYGADYINELSKKTDTKYIYSTMAEDTIYPSNWITIKSSKFGKIFKIAK